MKEKKIVLKRGAFGFGFSLNDDGESFVSTATVGKVEAGGAADLGGIRVGDQILTINGQPVQSMSFLQASNAIRASSELVELELANCDHTFHPSNQDSVRAAVPSPSIRHEPVDSPSSFRSSMATGNRVPYASSSTGRLTVVSQSTETTAVSSTVTIITAPSSITISSLSCTNSNPSRLSYSSPSAVTALVSAAPPPPTQPVPRPRRARNPLTAFNQPLDIDQTKKASRATAEPIVSQPYVISHCTSPKDSFMSASSSAIFDGSEESYENVLQDNASTVDNHLQDTPRPNRSKDKPTPETVQHLDVSVTKKAHRRQTFTRVCVQGGDTVDHDNAVGAPEVRFVRKRAYASARHAGRFDKFAVFGRSPDDSWSSSHSSTPTANVAQVMEPSTSPCQLLPAVPQHQPPSNVHIVEPKITHLPRRRSSKAQSSRPSVSLHRSRNSEEHELPVTVENNPSSSFSSKTPDSSARDESTSGHCPSAVHDRVVSVCAKVEPRSITDLAYCQTNETIRKPLQPPSLTSNQEPVSEALLTTRSGSKTDKLSGRLWASFDSDPDDNLLDWWSRVGETYQQLDLEYQRLVRRQTRLQQRQLTTDATEWGSEFAVGSNKENKTNGSVKSDRREIGVVLDRGPLVRMSASISSHATWSSPVIRQTDGSPVLSMGTTQTDGGDSQLSTQSNASRRRQLRNLCSGLRCHRSESNIHHDTSGSFRSRQSLCKILALDGGSTYKSYPWKPYYMCIAGTEVRFIKASSAFYGGNRKSKSTKHLPGDGSSCATSNTYINDMIDDRCSQDGSFRTNSSMVNGIDFQSSRMNWVPVSSTCSTSVLLPLPGLIWTKESVPPDLPHWRPLAPATGPLTTISRKPSPVPDTMDPIYSGLSEPTDGKADLGALIPTGNDESALQATFQCYRFAHVGAGVELLFVFPDENTASACLNMCEVSGGREATVLDAKPKCDSDGTRRKQYDLLFLNHTEPKDGSSAACSSVIEHTSTAQQVTCYANCISVKPDAVRQVASAVAAPWPPQATVQYKLTDRRQRRVEQQFSLHEGTVIRLVDSPIPVNGRQTSNNASSVASTLDSRSLHTSSLTVSTSGADVETQSEEKSTQRVTKSRNPAPFLRGIKQWLNRPAFPYGSASSSVESQLVPSSPTEATSVEMRLSAVLGDPPDFSDFETPGPIFGAPLEKQISSPDQPCVPVILQALVLGLEAHGLHLAGLYRKPGRHRTVAQFVCVANLAPSNIDLLLKLDAWREPNALCGLVKQFLRRIPTGLFASAAWEPLASLVDGRFAENSSQLAYLLLSIRVKLRKLASEAFGISIGHEIPVPLKASDPSTPLDMDRGAGSSITSPICTSPVTSGSVEPLGTPQSTSPSSATWRWATLCYLVRHIRDVVALQRLNEVSYQCIAICFGPVFFGESPNLTRLNEVLENLFRHWPWLIQDLPLVTFETMKSGASPPSLEVVHDYTLTEAVDYLTNFEAQSSASANLVPNFSIRSEPGYTETMEPDVSPHYGSLSLRSSDEQLNTQPVSPDANDERYVHVCQIVRALLDRASARDAGSTCDPINGHNETSCVSLHRVISAVSSAPRPSQNHTSSGRHRRKTVDTNTARSLNQPGRSDSNQSSHACGDSVFTVTVPSSREHFKQRRKPDGVIQRPSVPDRAHLLNLGAGHPSLNSSSSSKRD